MKLLMILRNHQEFILYNTALISSEILQGYIKVSWFDDDRSL